VPLNHKVKASDLASERARLLVLFGLGKGLSIDECLESSEINSCNFFGKKSLLDDAKEIHLIQNIIHYATSCPFSLGFEFGRVHQLNLLNKVSPSIFSSNNLTDAISTITASFSALFNLGSFDLSIKMPRLRLVFNSDNRLIEPVKQFISARNIGLIIALHQQLLTDKPNKYPSIQGAEEIGFDFSAPIDIYSLQDHLNCEVLFQQKENFMLINLMALDFSQPLINAVAAKVIEGSCCQSGAQTQEILPLVINLKDKVWSLLNEANYFSLNKEEAAVQLNMSQRTFSRRLQDEGTNWRNLVSDLRMKKARILLSEGGLTLQQISEQTGFSSASAFSSAFTKANGINAAEYRRKQNFNPGLELPDGLVARSNTLENLNRSLNLCEI